MAKTITARFTTYAGTAAQWSASSLVLLKGEIGLETDTGKFKFGNGVDTYGSLSYAVPTALSQLSADSTHRLVTDSEKSTWNGKQNALTFDSSPTAGSSNPVRSSGIKTALDTKANASSVPTKTSQLTNDSGYTTKTYVDEKVSSVYKFKGSVATYANLPTTGLTVGDVYNVVAAYGTYPAGTNWAWTSDNTWDALGGSIDLSIYIKSADVSTMGKTGKLSDGTQDTTHRVVTDTEKSTWNAKQNALSFDSTPTAGSTNPVTSGGVKTALNSKADTSSIPTTLAALAGDSTHRVVTDTEKSTWNNKQAKLTFDTTPTANSSNPVTSGGVKTALDTKASSSEIVKTSTGLTDSSDLMRYSDEIIINGGEL